MNGEGIDEQGKEKKVFWISMIILFVMCAIILWMKFVDYAYYNDIIGATYNELVERYGKPDSVIDTEDYKEVSYDEKKFICTGKRDSVYVSILEDKNIRFGIFQIGVGSPKKAVEFVYYFKQHTTDEEENCFGVKDGGYYVTFEYDENDRVKKMYVSFQG